MGLMAVGVIQPSAWMLQRLGLMERVVAWFSGRVRRRIAARNPFRGYTPTERDVFVATYVKSGTNWMMQIAHQLIWHARAEYEHIHSVVPWPDVAVSGPLRRYAIPIDDDSVWKLAPEHKRVVKTHLNWELIPYSDRARYIIVIRDPKDVFVSSYFFFVKNGPVFTSLSLETWLRLYLSDNFPMWGSWAVNTAGYWAERGRSNVLLVSFKSMKRDLRGTVCQVAKFLDIHVSNDIIDRVCEQASFEYMKQIDEKFRVWKMIPWGRESRMIRRGVQGGSSELLSADQQQQIDEYCVSELRRLGSDFPYEEFCDLATSASSLVP